MVKLGFSEGRNLVVLDRFGDEAALPGLMRELLAARVDAVLAIGSEAMLAASAATTTVPVVVFGADLLARGQAANLARPRGNVTGVVILGPELEIKRLQLLQQAVPAARRVAALLHSSAAQRALVERQMRAFAAENGLTLLAFDAAGPPEYPAAFAAMRAARADALVIGSHPILFRDARTLAQHALAIGLPTICQWAEMAASGCLLGYGPSRDQLRRQVAHQVARIFQGAAPADLPIETPTHFELAINLKTARALGVNVPIELLARADEVIE
jgi:putative ABC transport system substrate-binding protein